jgi:adsorption protein B
MMLALVAPLALLFVLSGLDDLGVDLAWFYAWVEYRLSKWGQPECMVLDVPAKTIAIMVPLWHEHEVIRQMLEHNLASIRYSAYHIFAGAYPNDAPTMQAIRAVADRFPNVHLAVCPHDGPTSKADCLNWIYQHIGLYEEQTGKHFDIIVTHDAEDMIHPDELTWINHYAARYDFVQIPVFALKTPWWDVVHGVYCDEFAECHNRDMVVRSRFRCFVPSSGVGTGYRREALEKLAESQGNRVFEPESLTEDYENGLRLRRLGCSQVFASPWRTGGPGSEFVATREFFPRTWNTALRQRTRWVTGIALQGWERFGWKGTTREVYWLWRDRKALVGSPMGVVANTVFLYGLVTRLWTRFDAPAMYLTAATVGLQVVRMAVRMGCVARVYGPAFSLGVPLRALYANALNAAATLSAIGRYARSKWTREPLRWLKTEHVYPSRVALLEHRRPLGDILTATGLLSNATLDLALETRTAGTLLGAHLLARGDIDEASLYQALSLQQGLPFTHLDAGDVPTRVARALPRSVATEWRVLPFKIAEDGISVASPDLPTPAMTQVLQNFTALEIRFHLLTPSEYERLSKALL